MKLPSKEEAKKICRITESFLKKRGDYLGWRDFKIINNNKIRKKDK